MYIGNKTLISCSVQCKQSVAPARKNCMGSCFSKSQELAPPAPKQEKNPRTASQKLVGHSLGGGETRHSSKEAAASAAESRYQAQQEMLKSSQAKLKAMEKISKKDKGLA